MTIANKAKDASPNIEVSFRCLYCDQEKPKSESTLEHAIPKFLGGAHAPLRYKIRNVCRVCNSNLGLHVDASYSRSWPVSNGLATAARKLYVGVDDNALPLSCMGPTPEIPNLQLQEGMVPELWLGPSGEAILWVRNEREDMYWYVGGNPIDTKTRPSIVYYFPTSSDPTRFRMGLEAFSGAFKKANARRICGATFVGPGANEVNSQFDSPTDLEKNNLLAIREAIAARWIKTSPRMNAMFDLRFMSKLVLAIGYSLFGEPFLTCGTAREARACLWQNESASSQLRGQTTFDFSGGKLVAELLGYPGAVAIAIIRSKDVYVLTISIDSKLPFVVELAPLSLQCASVGEDGYVLLSFPHLRHCVELQVPDLLAHASGPLKHPALQEIDTRRASADAFGRSLGPVSPN